MIEEFFIKERVAEYSSKEIRDLLHAIVANQNLTTLFSTAQGRSRAIGLATDYLLGLTNEKIDSKAGLYYDNSLPDIDIDFSDQRRAMAFDYMEKKYGREHIARLGTVALFKPRSSLQEAGAAFKIPRWKVEAFADTIIKRSGGDSRALQTMEDTFKETPLGRELIEQWPEIKTAMRMEGHPRHHSQHAAGIILTEKPVNHYVAVDKRTNATHCDKKDAEDLNLLKLSLIHI